MYVRLHAHLARLCRVSEKGQVFRGPDCAFYYHLPLSEVLLSQAGQTLTLHPTSSLVVSSVLTLLTSALSTHGCPRLSLSSRLCSVTRELPEDKDQASLTHLSSPEQSQHQDPLIRGIQDLHMPPHTPPRMKINAVYRAEGDKCFPHRFKLRGVGR